MPTAANYRSGSVVYAVGQQNNKIFILQSGAINLLSTDIATGKAVSDFIKQGEFFGVKSALGQYPREETAVAVKDSSVIAFTVPEFEALAAKNTRIIMQMLKVYSTQLRKISKIISSAKVKSHVRTIGGTADSIENTADLKPDHSLYQIGEYYMKNRRYKDALYVFSRYKQCYPKGEYAALADSKIQLLKEAHGNG
jgi:CRP-like cAMP-binding protein